MVSRAGEITGDSIPEEQKEAIRQAIEEQITFLKTTLDKAGIGVKAKIRTLEIHRQRLAEAYARQFRGAIQEIRQNNDKIDEKLTINKYTAELLKAVEGAILDKLSMIGAAGIKEIKTDPETLGLLARFYLNCLNNKKEAFDGLIQTHHYHIAVLTQVTESIHSNPITTAEILNETGYTSSRATSVMIRDFQNGRHTSFLLDEEYIVIGNEEIGWQLKKITGERQST